MPVTADNTATGAATANEPWQLRMFRRTLKKRQRLGVLRGLIGPLDAGRRCLMVTCGDNNGAMNWHLRQLGGQWTWADMESRSLVEMSSLLCQPVHHVQRDNLEFADAGFDLVVCIDAHEHVQDPLTLTRELARVTAPGGRVILSTPGRNRRKLIRLLKDMLGMKAAAYGHMRDGLDAGELMDLAARCGLSPRRTRSFSRFFTELVELALNYAYVKKLARHSTQPVEAGTIAPATSAQLASVGKAYRLYERIYPLVWLFSQLDWLLFFTHGHVAVVEVVRDVGSPQQAPVKEGQ